MVDQIQEIKDKVDIVDVISEHITVKKAGKNFKANCPFHQEKTPSFIISPDIGRYKCFGCGKSGDVFTFLEEYEGLEFVESLELLAKRAGIQLQKPKGTQKIRNDDLSALQLLSQFYHYILEKHVSGEEARKYLYHKRGLEKSTVDTFTIGYSPQNFSIFSKFFLEKKKIKPEVLLRIGQVYARNNSIKDRYAGRIVFPLYDHRGTVVGFSGRILPQYDTGQTGKYINTPETEYYHKSSLLFGLHSIKDVLREKREVLLVEGELDFLSLWQAGIKNVVAIKGTAITEDQAKILSRFVDTVILALDGDTAGDAAARRGITIAEKEGLEVKVVTLEGVKDPDEAVRKDRDEFKQLITKAQPAWDYLIDSAVKRYGTSGYGKSQISKEIIPILSSISDNIVRAHYVDIVARKLEVPHEAVYQEIRSNDPKNKLKPQNRTKSISNKSSRQEVLEKSYVSLLMQVESNYDLSKGIIHLFENSKYRKIIESYAKLSESQFSLKEFIKKLPQEMHELLAEIALDDTLISDKADIQNELRALEKELHILEIKDDLSHITKQIAESENEKNNEKIHSLQEEFRTLSERLTTLKQS